MENKIAVLEILLHMKKVMKEYEYNNPLFGFPFGKIEALLKELEKVIELIKKE